MISLMKEILYGKNLLKSRSPLIGLFSLQQLEKLKFASCYIFPQTRSGPTYRDAIGAPKMMPSPGMSTTVDLSYDGCWYVLNSSPSYRHETNHAFLEVQIQSLAEARSQGPLGTRPRMRTVRSPGFTGRRIIYYPQSQPWNIYEDSVPIGK
jgi:hypothetical protein